MKPSIFTAVLLCAWLGVLGRHAGAEPYHVVTEEWAPYNYVENDQLTGMTTDIVRAIMALTGDHFDVVMLPSLRSRYTLDTHPKTIMFSLFRTPEREPLYKWVGPIVEESIYPYQLADAERQVNSRDELLSAPQVTTRQAGLIPELLKAQGFNNLDRSASDNRQLYRMLMAGRTPIIIGDTAAGVAYYSRQLDIPAGTLRRIPVELYRSSLYIAFSLDSDDRVVAAWASALVKLRHTGELERIERRYGHPVAP